MPVSSLSIQFSQPITADNLQKNLSHAPPLPGPPFSSNPPWISSLAFSGEGILEPFKLWKF